MVNLDIARDMSSEVGGLQPCGRAPRTRSDNGFVSSEGFDDIVDTGIPALLRQADKCLLFEILPLYSPVGQGKKPRRHGMGGKCAKPRR